MQCRTCFGPSSNLTRPIIDLPQPRLVGSRYFSTSPRLLVVMLNPGAGTDTHVRDNRRSVELLRQFKDGQATLQQVFELQRSQMSAWGKTPGRFVTFYTRATGKALDQLAFANLALCATGKNQYPSWMLRECFKSHTRAIFSILGPDFVLLSGSNTHSYASMIREEVPKAMIIPMLHYAHRGGAVLDANEYQRVRELIAEHTHNG